MLEKRLGPGSRAIDTVIMAPYSAEAIMIYLEQKDILAEIDRRWMTDAGMAYVEAAADLRPLAAHDSPIVSLNDDGDQPAMAEEIRVIDQSLPTVSNPTLVTIKNDAFGKQADYGLLQTVRVPERAEGRHDVMLHTIVESGVSFTKDCIYLSLSRQGYAHDWRRPFRLLGRYSCTSLDHPTPTSRLGTRTNDGRDLYYAVLDCPEAAVRKCSKWLWNEGFRGHQNKTAEEKKAAEKEAESISPTGDAASYTPTLATSMLSGFWMEPVANQWSFGNMYQVTPSDTDARRVWILETADARYAWRSTWTCPGTVYAHMAQLIEARHGACRLRSVVDNLSPEITFGRFPTAHELKRRYPTAKIVTD